MHPTHRHRYKYSPTFFIFFSFHSPINPHRPNSLPAMLTNVQTPGIIPTIKSDVNSLLSSAKTLDLSMQTVYQSISSRTPHRVQKYVFPVAVQSMNISEKSRKSVFSSPSSIFQKCYMPTLRIRANLIGSPDRIVAEHTPLSPEVVVGVFIINDNKILMGLRTFVSIAANIYSLPGGHLEPGESYEECAAREVKEETGLDIKNIRIINANNLYTYQGTSVSATYLIAHLSDPNQTLQNVEPNKCDGWEWYDLNNLPQPMFEPLREMLEGGFNPFLI